MLPNGAVVVRYSGLPAIDSVDRMVTEAQVDLEFGSLEGDDPNLTFGGIRGIQAASDGTIYVLDVQAAEVRAYDPDGQYLRTVVRGGEGPGEITEANGIILAGDTLLWLNDHGKWSIIGVDRAGQEVRRFVKPIWSYGYIWDGAFDDRGRYWRHTSHEEGGFTYPPPPGLSSRTARNYYKSYDLSSEAIDSVYLGQSTFRSYTYKDPNGNWQFLPISFEPSNIFVLNPSGGFWRANSASYRIVRTGEGGDTLVVIEAGVPVQRVTDEDRSAYVEGWVEHRPEARRDLEAVAALMADVKPVLAGIFVDDEGVLWVERVVPSDAPAFYDRYSAEGDYLGSVRLAFEPAGGKIWVQHGSIYSWVVDELDVPFVVRAPLRWERR
ncbi:MAG: 6-bladed beta-propeller [Gemmatimonadetes bacterium]|nr:6-bladed beta-propeller [Gemmatimonadota bacterium]